jgi:hypothetical protein
MRPGHPIITDQVVPVAAVPRPVLPHEPSVSDFALEAHPEDYAADFLDYGDLEGELGLLDVLEGGVQGDAHVLAFYGLDLAFYGVAAYADVGVFEGLAPFGAVGDLLDLGGSFGAASTGAAGEGGFDGEAVLGEF